MVLLRPCIHYLIVLPLLAGGNAEAVGGRAIADARSPQASAFAIT
jgi:hypothetical protein